MQIPIISGIYADSDVDFRNAYPRNLMPIAHGQGISNGYLRPGYGIVSHGTVPPGIGRAGINWDGALYRVMGTKLVSIDASGNPTTLGDVGGTTTATLDYSFDRLAVASNNNLFYWDGASLTQVTDPDLGTVLDVIWVDGYFMTTDGENLVVTELSDPTQVNPLKYGSSEADPDPVKALLKVKNEPHALNRYTIEVFDNIGGDLFPFARIEGAQIEKGVIGTHACCVFDEKVAFVGGGRNEGVSVYLGLNGQVQEIADQEIIKELKEYTEGELGNILVETQNDKNQNLLYIHLPGKTLVYDHDQSKRAGSLVWFTLSSSASGEAQYKANHLVYCYDKWQVSDPASVNIGYLDDSLTTHWGSVVQWQFSTPIIYNESRGAIVHRLELVNLKNDAISVAVDYSDDGETFSSQVSLSDRARFVWLKQGFFQNWRIYRFTGSGLFSAARLEAQLEPLYA